MAAFNSYHDELVAMEKLQLMLLNHDAQVRLLLGARAAHSDRREGPTFLGNFRLDSVSRCGSAALDHCDLEGVSGTRTDQ